MAAYSKLFTANLPYSCYDVVHPWTPFCTVAAASIFIDSIIYSGKIYSILYLIKFLLQRKKITWKSLKRLFLDIFHSTLFLTWNGFAFTSFFCLFRRLIGYYFFLNAGFLQGFASSFTAILLERKSRRRLLGVYVFNVILDSMYRMARYRGYIQPIPNGEILLFSTSMAGFLYFYKKREDLHDITGKVLSYLIGFEDGGNSVPAEVSEWDSYSRNKSNKDLETSKKSLEDTAPFNGKCNRYCSKLFYLLQERLRKGPRHHLCLHKFSCYYYWITGFLRSFFIGYCAQTAATLITSLPKIFKNPPILNLILMKKKNAFKFGAFLGCFCAVFKMTNCILRWTENSDTARHGLLAGFLASLTMILYPMPSIAMYTFCKLLDILYTKGMNAGYCPSFPYGVEIFYALVTGFMFHVAVLEPHNLRPSYWKFLMNLTNYKFGKINRNLLQEFGTDSAKMLSHVKYNYNHKYTSQYLKNTLKIAIGT